MKCGWMVDDIYWRTPRGQQDNGDSAT